MTHTYKGEKKPPQAAARKKQIPSPHPAAHMIIPLPRASGTSSLAMEPKPQAQPPPHSSPPGKRAPTPLRLSRPLGAPHMPHKCSGRPRAIKPGRGTLSYPAPKQAAPGWFHPLVSPRCPFPPRRVLRLTSRLSSSGFLPSLPAARLGLSGSSTTIRSGCRHEAPAPARASLLLSAGAAGARLAAEARAKKPLRPRRCPGSASVSARCLTAAGERGAERSAQAQHGGSLPGVAHPHLPVASTRGGGARGRGAEPRLELFCLLRCCLPPGASLPSVCVCSSSCLLHSTFGKRSCYNLISRSL